VADTIRMSPSLLTHPYMTPVVDWVPAKAVEPNAVSRMTRPTIR
jgi:hypothetical protein